jgi:hypothetical protein
LSELEQEFELEMDDSELDEEAGADEEFEEDSEADEEFEGAGDYEEDMRELEADEEAGDYAERFYELAQRGYESEAEVAGQVDELLREMEQEYFFGGLVKKGLGALKKRASQYARKKFKSLGGWRGLGKLAGGLLSGKLGAIAKQLAALSPQGAAALAAFNALRSSETGEDSEADRETWDNYVRVCKEAYEHLAQNLDEMAADPSVASELAHVAFKTAMNRHKHRRRLQVGGLAGAVRAGVQARTGAATPTRRRRRVVRLRPGEYLVVYRKRH